MNLLEQCKLPTSNLPDVGEIYLQYNNIIYELEIVNIFE